MKERVRQIKNHYEPLLEKYAGGYKVLDWESREAQIKRFEILCQAVDLSGKKLLDVGCGAGDLYGFLSDRRIDVSYRGVDLLEKMVERARSTYPRGRFFSGDIFQDTMFSKKQFDVVFCSGLFTLNLGNNEVFFEQALPVLFGFAREYVVFNMLGEGGEIHGNQYYYFREKEVIHRVRKYSNSVRCMKHYIPWDFTIAAESKDFPKE